MYSINTGSKCSVINENTYHKLSENTTLLKSRSRLNTYMGEPIPVIGKVNVAVQHNEIETDLQLTVTSGMGPNLIGQTWIRML